MNIPSWRIRIMIIAIMTLAIIASDVMIKVILGYTTFMLRLGIGVAGTVICFDIIVTWNIWRNKE